MAGSSGVNAGKEKFVYRISSAKEWESLQQNGSILGGDLDKSTGCIHLSTLNQVQSTLQNFFLNFPEDLYLLQIDADKLGDGLIYEAVDESNVFPHFYGPSRSFVPLPLSVVVKAEKLTISDAVLASILCKKKVVIFNFGDSNSDTGGLCAGLGYTFGYPNSRTYFHQPSERLCDGRLIIDYLCEALNTSMLTPYLESLAPDFSNGANFAIGGSSTLPKYVPFSLNIQILEYLRFKSRSSKLYSKGFKNLVGGEEEFKKALYMIDIGQNDLAGAFSYLQEPEVINKIPSFISEIRDALWAIYNEGGRNFWVHNTGPLGCLPQKLATRSNASGNDIDGVGCLKSMNEAAMAFNGQLKALCDELRVGMQNATIVYVDIFTIKYDLIANSAKYGFNKNPLMACCGFGGPPYNYKQNFSCGQAGYNVCKEGSRYVSWDGVHYTDAANSFVASKILSTNHSSPPVSFDFFCKS